MAAYWRMIINGRIFNKQSVVVFSKFSTNAQPVSSTKKAPLNVDKPIVIPAKIKRGPTDILEALSSTFSRDFTAPHYKYHDDPYFIPASNIAKRSFALSKESGREAARWILQNNPSLFAHDAAEPHVEAFMAPTVYDETSNADVNTLRYLIKESRVREALSVFNTLKKNVEIDDETLQEMLELLCFYNCQEPPKPDSIETLWLMHQTAKEQRKTWRDKGPAELLFKTMKSPGAEAYSAIIIGMAKYLQVDGAYQHYQEMREKQIPANVDVYNALLQIVMFLSEGSENRWRLVEEFLSDMDQAAISPNLNTFNAVLENTTKLNVGKSLALNTLAEMKHFGIEPCLASYYYLLVLFCKERGPTSGILYDIMERIEGKDLILQHPKDLFFFVKAMNVCHDHLQDKELAYRVYRLLLHGKNGVLIGDAMKESIFYQHFFNLLAATEDINKFFEMYYKLVPNIYTPEPSVMESIIEAIEINRAWQYIPQIWSDIINFSQVFRTNIIEYLLKITANNKPETEELQQQFVEIVLDMHARIQTQHEDKFRSVVHWTGDMLGNIILTCLNGDRYENACEVFQQCEKDKLVIFEHLHILVIKRLISAAIEKKDAERAIACLQYAADAGYPEVKPLAQKIQESLTLNEDQQATASELGLASCEKDEL